MKYDYLCRTKRWLSIRSLNNERWADVPASTSPGYQVSDMGRIRKVNEKGLPIKILKPSPDTKGYCRVNLNDKFVKVHRLVALMFVPNPQDKPNIDHINGDRGDNRAENLRWVTTEENANNPTTRKRHDASLELVRKEMGRGVVIMSKEGVVTSVCDSIRKAGILLGKPFESIASNLRNNGVYYARVSDEMYCVKRASDVAYQYTLF